MPRNGQERIALLAAVFIPNKSIILRDTKEISFLVEFISASAIRYPPDAERQVGRLKGVLHLVCELLSPERRKRQDQLAGVAIDSQRVERDLKYQIRVSRAEGGKEFLGTGIMNFGADLQTLVYRL